MLGYSLLTASAFALLVAWIVSSGAGLVYFIYVLPVAYLITFGMLAVFVTSSRRRLGAVAMILVGALLITGVTVAFTASHGYPIAYNSQGFSTSCTEVKVQNATSPSGYTNSTVCSSTPTSSSSAQSFVLDFLYWLPISGLTLYTLPGSRRYQSSAEQAGYTVFCLVLLAALILPITGLLPVVGS